jgi:hypothetical protein
MTGECAHHGGDPAVGEWGDVPNGQAGGRGARGQRGRDRLLSVCEQRSSLLVQGGAGGSELDAVGVAINELGADTLLELADLAAERLLGEVKPLRGAGEVELLADGDEGSEVAHLDVHARSLWGRHNRVL